MDCRCGKAQPQATTKAMETKWGPPYLWSLQNWKLEKQLLLSTVCPTHSSILIAIIDIKHTELLNETWRSSWQLPMLFLVERIRERKTLSQRWLGHWYGRWDIGSCTTAVSAMSSTWTATHRCSSSTLHCCSDQRSAFWWWSPLFSRLHSPATNISLANCLVKQTRLSWHR